MGVVSGARLGRRPSVAVAGFPREEDAGAGAGGSGGGFAGDWNPGSHAPNAGKIAGMAAGPAPGATGAASGDPQEQKEGAEGTRREHAGSPRGVKRCRTGTAAASYCLGSFRACAFSCLSYIV